MTEEKEILTILSKSEYDNVLSHLKKNLGLPKTQKRLSLQSDNYDQEDIDTRIKITNGKVELIQKVGDWKNITTGKSRTEIKVTLQKDAKNILDLYKVLRNLNKDTSVQNIVMQYENYLWKIDNYEIKLTHQFGNSDAFNCEVEVFNNSLNPENLARQYNIPINLPTQTQDFWREWNERVNLPADKLSDEQLLEIINKYL